MAAILVGSASLIASGADAAVEPAPGITILTTQVAQGKNTTSISIDTSSDIQVGDVVLVHVGAVGATAADESIAAPAGWNVEDVQKSSSMVTSWVFSHVATKAGKQTFVFSTSRPFALGATLTAYRGVDRYHPVDVVSGKMTGATTDTTGVLTSPAVVTSAGNAKAVWFGSQVWHEGVCPTIGAPSGFTPRGSLCTVPDNALSLTVSDRQLGVAAAHPAWAAQSPKPYTNTAQVVVLRPAPAASAHRGLTTTALTATAETPKQTIEVGRPLDARPGDVLLAHVSNRNDISATLSAPEGWVAVPTDSGTTMQSSYSIKSWIFYRVVTANEPATYVFTSSRPARMTAMVSAFSGVDTVNPIDSMEGKVNSNAATLDSAKNTVTSDATRLVWYATQTIDDGAACQTLTPPSGFSTVGTACMLSPYAGLASIVSYSGRVPAGKFAFNGTSSAAATNVVEMVGLRSAPAVSAATDYASASTLIGSVTVASKAELWEASGVASSRINPNTVYVHSEEDHATMLALDVRGSAGTVPIVGRYTWDIPALAGGSAMFDWEDIAVGPCPSGSCVYAGDIGASRGSTRVGSRRTTGDGKSVNTIWRAPEPVTNGVATAERTTLPVEAFHFVYPDRKSADAEAIMVHPRTGDIYVLTKANGVSDVYKLPAGTAPSTGLDDIRTLTKVSTIQLPVFTTSDDPALAQFKDKNGVWNPALGQNSGTVTAASIHPDGNRFLVRTYFAVYEFTVPAGGSFDSAFNTSPRKLTTPQTWGNSEAIGYAADGSGYFSMDEQYDSQDESKAMPHFLVRVDRT